MPQFWTIASFAEVFAGDSTSCVLWQSEQTAAYWFLSSSTALPWTDLAYSSRCLAWHLPQVLGMFRRHSVRASLPAGYT